MIIKQKLKSEHNLTAKAYKAISQEAWELAGVTWHTRILPKHFEAGADAVYDYKKRSKGYLKAKRHVRGHERPLEWSGRLKRQVTATAEIRSSGNSRRRQGKVKIALRGPAYLQAVRRNPSRPSLSRELGAVTERDAQILARVMDDHITRRLSENSAPRATGRE